MSITHHIHASFDHEAFLYDSDAEYVATLVPYLLDGLAQGDAAVAVVTPEREALLREGLGDAAADVEFIDARTWYDRPSTTIAGYDDYLVGLGGRRARVIGEVEFHDTPEAWADW